MKLTISDESEIYWEGFLRRSGRYLDPVTRNHQKGNDYIEFLIKCESHADKVLDYDIKEMLHYEISAWEEISDPITEDKK